MKLWVVCISFCLCCSLNSKAQVIVEQNFDGGNSWAYSSSVTYFSHQGSNTMNNVYPLPDGWSGDGFYGIIDMSDANGLDYAPLSGNVLGERDLDDEGDFGTGGDAITSFADVDITGCSNVQISFDFDVEGYNANSDEAFYEVYLDGSPQGRVVLQTGSTSGDNAQGTITYNVPGGTNTIALDIIINNNGSSGYSGFDNFEVSGSGCGGSGPTSETNCSDGIDNDGDGDVDCADGDCSSDPSCSGSGSSCTYELQLDDTYGDGWNGNSIDVTINGSTTNYTVTDPPGYQNIITLNVNDGDQIELEYDNSGTYDYENEIILTDGNGDVVYQDGQGGATPTTSVQTFTVDCSTSGSGGSGCTDGAIGVTGSGCGCLSGCNLSSLGGPNCSPSVGGNCDAGQTFMSEDITVPAGCTFMVSAEMRVRPGCSASGGDGGDQMKVDVVGGSKPYQSGSSNSTQIDSYSLVGPGTIRISGTANRADEIITYTVSSSGAFCNDCMSTLATELLEFNAIPQSSSVDLKWTALSEIDHDYYVIQRSKDGYTFKDLHQVAAQGSSSSAFQYTTVDRNPHFGLSYYRLKQVDINGNITYSDVRSVEFKGSSEVSIFPNPAAHSFNINAKNQEIETVKVFNTTGQLVNVNTIASEASTKTFSVTSLSKGTYIVNVKLSNGEIVREKLVITR